MLLEDVFGASGYLAAAFAHYERRASQVEMAQQVENVLEGGGVLLAEAGTGTGKTLAYLAPILLSNHTVVISTGTRNLQDQIYFKDLATLCSALGVEVEAAYLKGQENYLCHRRLQGLLHSPRALAHPSQKLERLIAWSRFTDSGDRMELSDLPDDDPLWHEVCSTRETRIGHKCPFHGECFVTRARQKAARARLVVVNHHLYFADLSTRRKGGSLLPKHSAVVFDEAHLVEDIATEFFSTAVSSAKISYLVDDVLSAVRTARLSEDPYEMERPRLADATKASATALFVRLRGNEPGRTSFDPAGLSSHEESAYHKLDSALEALQRSVEFIGGKDEAIDHVAGRCVQLRNDLGELLSRPPKGFVSWLETRQRSVVVGMSPVDVSEMLRDGVFYALPSVILVSATLSAGGDFSYLKNRLGLDFPTTDMSLPSPFNFERQARLFLPPGLPDPRDPGFVETAADWTRQLISITGGGALILCTSVKNMHAMRAHLEAHAPGPLLLQGEAPKSALIARFLEDDRSILCATASFWQGVDLPGDALRLVVIDKLPFASPADPLTAARIRVIEEHGNSAFSQYQLPQAALQLKQGFGRLVRTARDRGIVAILDRRLQTMAYAKLFLRSLPRCPITREIDELADWWTRTSSNSDEG